MSDQQTIHVNVQSGTGEILRIIATILLFGGLGAIAWSVAQGPNAELAASGFSMMLVMMLRLSYSAGRLRLPSGTGGTDDFATTKSTVAQILDEYKRALARANILVTLLISAAYAIGFLLLRAGVAAALGIFSNFYIAGGTAAMVGALVVFPSLLPSIVASLRRKGVVADPVPGTQVNATQVVSVTPPVTPPVTRSTPPKKVVVRKVVAKRSDSRADEEGKVL